MNLWLFQVSLFFSSFFCYCSCCYRCDFNLMYKVKFTKLFSSWSYDHHQPMQDLSWLYYFSPSPLLRSTTSNMSSLASYFQPLTKFLSLHPNDILTGQLFVVGTCPLHYRMSNSCLAPTCYIPVAPFPPVMTTKSVSRHCHMSPECRREGVVCAKYPQVEPMAFHIGKPSDYLPS